jgi:hypothetical protein
MKHFLYNLTSIFNDSILLLFNIIYKVCKIENIEDKYHKEKKDNNKFMNKVKLEFVNEKELEFVKKNIINIIENNDFLDKYNITKESILNKTNNKLFVSFSNNNIYIYFNHYYISGSNMFILLNKIVNGKSPKFLNTNPLYAIINLPYYIYDMMLLQKKKYEKKEKQIVHLYVEKNIITSNKRFCLYLNILQKIYQSLQFTNDMVVAITIAFDELPNINNNVGIIIIKYNINDSIDILEKKIRNASYQAYVSNFILNCPIPKIGNFELREYVDCIISSMYIKSDLDFKIGWNCSKPTIEEIYVGSVSILHSNKTMDINMVFNTCSSNYKKSYECIENFFEE